MAGAGHVAGGRQYRHMSLDIERSAHGRWVKGQAGNPGGARPREQSIAAALRRKLDVRKFCDHLIGLAMGTIEGTPPNTQVLACRCIMSYCDGLPVRQAVQESHLKVEICYHDQPMPANPATMIIDESRQLETGDQDEVSG